MFFLNLTAGEFLGLLVALGALITTLYLLDRTRRKKVVSTLRFWNPALAADQQQSRKRVREPWSLLLQLVSLTLLLLAIAQLEWGTRQGLGHDHVLLLDTSSWSAEGSADGTLLDREKRAAEQYLSALASRDRVMLVRADALATPVTRFTSDRQQLLRAIRDSSSEFSALNIAQALSFARQAQAWSGGRQGEIVYVGPKLVQNTVAEDETTALPGNSLRVISVSSDRENCGIRAISVKRGEDEPNSWQATITLKNYGSEPRMTHLRTQFAGTVFAARVFSLAPGRETAAQYNFVTNTAGLFAARIEPHDRLPADDQASLELPRSTLLRVAVFTNRPEVLRPVLEANHRLTVTFISPVAYVSLPAADVMLLDQFAPPPGSEPKLPSFWIEPPTENSPLPIQSVVKDAVIQTWHSDRTLTTGLHAKEANIGHAEVFQTFEGDQPLGSIAQGPVVVLRNARGTRQQQAVVGFDPLSGAMRFEVTTPLLFASLLRWLSPDASRTVEFSAGRVGTATVTLDKNEDASTIRVTGEKGFAIPFTVRDQALELFSSRPGIVRVVSAGRERVLSLTLPDVAELEWNPPGDTLAGVPRSHSFSASGSTSIDIWQGLAILGGLALLTEWLLFGRRRGLRPRTVPASNRQPAHSGSVAAPAQKEHLVSK